MNYFQLTEKARPWSTISPVRCKLWTTPVVSHIRCHTYAHFAFQTGC